MDEYEKLREVHLKVLNDLTSEPSAKRDAKVRIDLIDEYLADTQKLVNKWNAKHNAPTQKAGPWFTGNSQVFSFPFII